MAFAVLMFSLGAATSSSEADTWQWRIGEASPTLLFTLEGKQRWASRGGLRSDDVQTCAWTCARTCVWTCAPTGVRHVHISMPYMYATSVLTGVWMCVWTYVQVDVQFSAEFDREGHPSDSWIDSIWAERMNRSSRLFDGNKFRLHSAVWDAQTGR